jgi:hypothetical protein
LSGLRQVGVQLHSAVSYNKQPYDTRSFESFQLYSLNAGCSRFGNGKSVNLVNTLEGYKEIEIVSPQEL